MPEVGFEATEIRRLEEALRLAMLQSDAERLDELIADDLIFTDHAGRLLDKRSDLEAHSSGLLRIRELNLLDQQIRSSGEAAVVVACFAIKGILGSAEFSNVFRFTRVWAKRAGHWSIIAAHSSLVSEPPSQEGELSEALVQG